MALEQLVSDWYTAAVDQPLSIGFGFGVAAESFQNSQAMKTQDS